MDKKIRFRGYLTFDDSLKVQKLLEKKKLFAPPTAISLTTLAITAFVIYKMKVEMVFAIFLLLFMGFFMYGGFRLMKGSAGKTQKKIYEKACTSRNGTLTNDFITIRKQKTTTNIPWKFFEKAIEKEGIITVMKGKETLSFAR